MPTIPLLKDYHNHPSIYACLQASVNLGDCSDKATATARIMSSCPADRLSIILGWNSGFYEFTKEELAKLPPVFICNISLHSYLVNSKGAEFLTDKFPDVIESINDPEWVERNLYRIKQVIGHFSPLDAGGLKKFFNEYLMERGVYYAEDMLVLFPETISLTEQAGVLERTKLWAPPDVYGRLDKHLQEKVNGLKIFTDGAIGAGSAAVNADYKDGKKGILLYTDEELFNLIKASLRHDKPFSIHAIGDQAIEQTISAIEQVKADTGKAPTVRIEHCQFITRAQAARAKSLGLLLGMQPNFSFDSKMYDGYLPTEFLKGNNPFRMLIDEYGFQPGKDLLLGSDGMPHGAQFALEQSLLPSIPGQRLTLEEFCAGYCMPDQSHGRIELDISNDSKITTKILPAS